MKLLPIVSLITQILCGASFVLPKDDTGCSIDLTRLDPEPIVVSAGDYQFLYAEPDESTVNVQTGQNVTISCPGGTLTTDSISQETIQATCYSGNIFTNRDGKVIQFNQLACSRNPFHTARYTGNSCELGGVEIEIGFVLDDDEFAREILICFSHADKSALYSAYNLTRSIGHHESGVPRPSFIEDNFYNLGVTVNSLYVRGGQRETINSLLGLPASSTKYIQDNTDYYLARGHFTAKADFVYAPQQTATFHYVNVAPQWQTFNGQNWENAESDVRDYAEANKLDLVVYTGPYGVTTLPHATTGEETPLYLYVDANGNNALPVPELYWKVVYSPESQQGVALLGVNNPYRDDFQPICEDVSSRITWLHWEAADQERGYSYACDINELRPFIPQLPDFEVTDLLL